MYDPMLYYFWMLITALFVFSAIYSWFIAIIVRRTFPGEVVWINMGLAFITATNAFIRGGQQIIDPHAIVSAQRAMWFMVGVSMVVAVVMLGRQYNGEFSKHLPLSQQWRLLKRGIKHKERKRDDALAEE